jgi:hypothetical protein
MFFESTTSEEIAQHYEVLTQFLQRNQLVIEMYPPLSFLLYKFSEYLPLLYSACNIFITAGTSFSLFLLLHPEPVSSLRFLPFVFVILLGSSVTDLASSTQLSPIMIGDVFSELSCLAALALSLAIPPPRQPSFLDMRSVCFQGALLATSFVSGQNTVSTSAALATFLAIVLWNNFQRLADHGISLVC